MLLVRPACIEIEDGLLHLVVIVGFFFVYVSSNRLSTNLDMYPCLEASDIVLTAGVKS